MLILLMSLMLAAGPKDWVTRCVGCEREEGRIKRSSAKVHAFYRAVGWDVRKMPPAIKVNGKTVQVVVVDHIIALACGPGAGGRDEIGNMQLQWASAGRAKDRWERHKDACAPETQADFLARHGQPPPSARPESPAPWAVSAAKAMQDEYAAMAEEARRRERK